MKNITIKHVANWIFSAWNNVPITVIINCFKHVGIIGPDVEEISTESKESTLIASVNILSIEEPKCINEEIQIYKNVTNENWEDMIINPMVEKNTETENFDELHLQQTRNTAMECLKILSEYALYNDLDEAIEPISKLQNILILKKLHSMKSTTLDTFFSNKD